jgi:hypothetical protein
MALTTDSATFTLAHRLSSASTSTHGAGAWSVRSSISSTAALYCGHFSRFRQSSAVSFQAFSGSRSRALNRLSCSSRDRCIQNLTMIMPSSASVRSKSTISR